MGIRKIAYRFLIRCGGHSPDALETDSPEFTQPIVLAGGTVLVAGSVAALNWGIAGYSIAEKYGTMTSVSVAALMAGIGVGIVAAIDRTAVYQMDTQSSHFLKSTPMALARAALVILVSMVTTHAIAPLYLHADLVQKAFERKEADDARRQMALLQGSAVGTLTGIKDAAHENATLEQNAIDNVPIGILLKERQAKECSRANAAQMQKLSIRHDTWTSEDAKRFDRLKRKKSACDADFVSAQAEHIAYVKKHTDMLAGFKTAELSAQSDTIKQLSEIDTKQNAAKETEKDAITEHSAIVLDDLLESSPSARMKWYAFLGGVTLLELLALWTKALGEKSVPGFRIGTNRKIEILHHTQRARAAEDEYAWNVHFRESLTEALSLPQVREEIVKQFLIKAYALIPFQVCSYVISEIERGARDVEAAKRRYPDYAGAIAEAWTGAIQEVTQLLRNGAGAAAAPSY